MKTLHFHNSISVKQILFLWFVLCLFSGMTQANNNRCDNSLTVPLLIDQKTQVGVVKVNFDDHRLNIQYEASQGWLIEKTHLAVSSSFEELPQDRYGNPKLRDFPHKSSHSSPVAVVNHMLSSSRWPLGTELYIAAQADVVSVKHGKDGKHHKSRHSAKSWSHKKQNTSHDYHEDKDSHGKYSRYKHDDDNSYDMKHRSTKYIAGSDYRKTRLSGYFGKSYFGKARDYHKSSSQTHRQSKRCEQGHKNYDHSDKEHSRKQRHDNYSSWGKGNAFNGKKEGYYFTFTLSPCKPVVNSTFQFDQALYSSSEDAQNAIVTVTRTGDLFDEASVIIRTADGTAQAGVDYDTVDQQLVFAAGQTTMDVIIPVIDDSDVEDVETINVQLFDAQEATLGDQDTAIVEITDNDEIAPQPALFFFEPADYMFREGSGEVTITVARTGDLIGEASVDYLVVGGTAQPNIDYILIPGTLVFADGQSSATISLTIREDRAVDPAETILVGITNPVNGEIAQPAIAAVITIEDNEGQN